MFTSKRRNLSRKRDAKRIQFNAVCESLEGRQLLSAVVQPNASDYAPGSVAVFTALNDTNPGPNFQAGETINFHVGRTDGIPIISPPAVTDWNVVDGPDGSVVTNWNVDPQFAGASLSVTATGVTSGATATALFTDGYPAALSVTPVDGTAQIYGVAGNAIYTVKVTDNTDGNPLSAWLSTPALPAGLTATWSANAQSPGRFSNFGNSHYGLQFAQGESGSVGYATLTLTTTATDSAGNYPFTVEVAKNSDPSHGFVTANNALTINHAPVVLTVSDAGGIYKGSRYTATATINGGSSLEGVTPWLDYRTADGMVDLGTQAPANVGSYRVLAQFDGSANYASADSNYAYFSITPASLSLDAGWAFKPYDGNTNVVLRPGDMGPSIIGLHGTDTVTNLTESFASPNVGPNSTQINHGFVINDGNGGRNYTVTTSNGPGEILPATATVSVTAIPGLVYNGTPQETASYSATGVNGALPSSDFTDTTVYTDAGTYHGTWTFADPNYVTLTDCVISGIARANASVTVYTYSTTYDGQAHTATGVVLGVNDTPLAGLDLSQTQHTDAGTYSDNWSFVDQTGNYNDIDGSRLKVTDTIDPATAAISVLGYSGSFDGVVHGATVDYATGVNGVSLSGEINLGDGFTNAPGGTAHWTFTDPNYIGQSGDVGIVINRIAPTITVVDAGGVYTYNGTAHAATILVNGGSTLEGVAPIAYGYYHDAGSRLIWMGDKVPTNAGDYLVDAWFPGSTDYSSWDTFARFTIAPAIATVNVTGWNGVYDGQLHGASGNATGVNGESLYLHLGASFTAAPGGNAHWYLAGYDNYTVQYGDVPIDIAKADAIIDVTGYDTTYNGASHTATGTATGVNGELLSGLDLSATQHTNANGPAGSVDDFTFTDQTGNYNDKTSQVFDRIGKVDLTVVAFDTSKIYDGSPEAGFPWAVTGFVNGENMGNASGDPGFTGSAVGAVNAGSYTITPTVGTLTATNYNFTTFVDGALTITKADASDLIKVIPYNVTYDGNVHTATGVNPVGDLDLTQTQHTNAGVYTDTWFFHGGQNYEDTHGQVIDTISKANATVKVTPYNVTYNAQSHTATGTATGVNCTNLASDLTIVSAHTNAGTYGDSWTFNDPNYVSQSGKFTDVISKADATGIKVIPYTVTYDGNVHTATGVNPVGNLDLTQTKHANAGIYTDKWFFHGGQNYNDTQGTVTDVINKANATIKVTPYNVNYNAVVHSATGTVTGVNGALPSSDLVLNSAHTNAGVYGDSWTFNDPNYVSQSGKFTDVINKANVTVKVAPYNVTYNGAWHAATGTVAGVNGQALAGLNLNSTVHINAGVYRDAWYFTDNTGNYNSTSGLTTDVINKANALIFVNAYNVLFDGNAHASTGVAIGVYGQALAGLNLGSTVHLGGYYTTTFYDRWTFTDTTGNYNSTSGTVVDTIRANQPLYRALYKPFCPKSPFAGRLFMW